MDRLVHTLSMRFGVLIGFLIFFNHMPFSRAAVPVIRVLGETAGHVVTSREVELDIVVERVLYDLKNKGKFEVHLDRVLLEWAVFKEAGSFGISDISESEISSMTTKFLSDVLKSKYAQRWKQLDVRRPEVFQLMQRKLRARKFINFKVSASYVPITDAEALNYYQKNRRDFGKTAFAKVRSRIKDLISHERAQARLDEWYKVLERKYEIKKVSR